MTDFATGAAVCARYRVVHETRYNYQSSVSLSQQYLHLTPRSFAFQQTESHLIWLDPAVNESRDGVDYFGNGTRHVSITVPHDSLLVHAESTVALRARPGLAQIAGTLPWESVRDMMGKEKSAATLEACRYLYASPHVTCFPALQAYARLSYTPGRPQLDAALDLTQRIFDDFEFDDKATDISTPLEQDDRLPTQPRPAGALHQRLHPDPPAGRQAAPGRRRRLARLGVGIFPGAGLGRFRPDQPLPGAARTHHAGLGPRLQRCHADARHRARRWAAGTRRAGDGDAAAAAGRGLRSTDP
jgi:hypothetical protein